MDLSTLSDDQLRSLYQQPQQTNPLASMSDAQLLAAHQAASNQIGGVGDEIKRAFNENADAIGAAGPQGFDPKNYNSLQSTLNVGKAIAAIPGLLASPITGAARSLIGRGFDAVSPLTQEQRDQYGLESGRDVADMAMMGLSPRGVSPVGPRLTPAPTSTAVDLKNAGKSVFNDPAVKNIPVGADQAKSLADTISSSLTEQGFRPTRGSAPETFGEIGKIAPAAPQPSFWDRVQAEMNGQAPPMPTPAPMSVADLRASRSALNITAKQLDPATHQPTPDAAAATQAIRKIDDLLDSLSPALRDANANYTAGKSSDRLDYRTIKADRRAAKSGSGMNMENTIRQEVDKISDRGLTPDQIAQRDAIVLGTPVRNSLRTVGKLGVDGGLSLMLHSGAALGTGGTTLPITIGGTIARKVGEGLTRSAIRQLSDSIRSNSPLARSLAPVPAPSPNPLMGLLGSQTSLAELLAGLRAYPALAPSYADQKQR